MCFKLVKFGASVSAAINCSFLFSYKIHCMRKWLSSPTFVGKEDRNVVLSGFLGFTSPFSIIRPLSESLNLVNVIREVILKFDSVHNLSTSVCFWK